MAALSNIPSTTAIPIPRRNVLKRMSGAMVTGAALSLFPYSITSGGSKDVPRHREIWLSKWRRFVDAEKKYSEAVCREDEAESTAKGEYPSKRLKLPGVVGGFSHGNFLPYWSDTPPCNYVTLGKGKITTRAEIEKHFEDRLKGKWIEKHSAEGRAAFLEEGKNRRAKILAEFDAWEAARMEIDLRHDVPALRNADETTYQAMTKAEQDIADSTATSFAAIAVKLALWHRIEGEDHDGHTAEIATMSALRGASALAGLPSEFWLVSPAPTQASV